MKLTMASEHLRLVRKTVHIPSQSRPTHVNTCYLITSTLFVALLVVLLSPSIATPSILLQEQKFSKKLGNQRLFVENNDIPFSERSNEGPEYDQLRRILLETPDQAHAARWSAYYTAGPHLAGKNRTQAEWTRDLWLSFGIQSEIVSYDVYINYPKSNRLALLHTNSKGVQKVQHECLLDEDVLEDDPTTSLRDRIPTFHGYSAPGNVTAQFVYVNFGTIQDYDDLVEAGIPLEGKIALVKYGRNFRGIKVQLAQSHGMVGVVMYDDPQEDGDITEQNGYQTYPDGPARNPSAVQRGSVQFLSLAPGDPTTIGYPSKAGAVRQSPNNTTPQIPSLPISYRDAIPLLKALNGHGPDSRDFNKWWQGGGLEYLGVRYNIGPTPPDTVLNLENEVDYTISPIWNVIGIINGSAIPNQSVVMGNHRDAWIAGGAADPNSGSAALNEVVRSFGKAIDQGWSPQRTIVFASWDGEEYGLLGSTEWVEEYIPWLKAETMAYLNVDVATSGPLFHASASPLLNYALKNAASHVMSPNQTIHGQTVLDVWRDTNDAHISTLGSGSDYTAFIDMAGIPSVDFGFTHDRSHAVYHYHSNYDSYHWMKVFGDSGFDYHVACAKLLSILAAEIAENPIVPFIATDYAKSLIDYLKEASDVAKNASISINDTILRKVPPLDRFERLQQEATRLLSSARRLDDEASEVMLEIKQSPFLWRLLCGRYLKRKAERINKSLRQFERSFLYENGLSGRSWFKHVVFAPGKWTGYAGARFPGLIESIKEGNIDELDRWEQIIECCLRKARGALRNI